MEKQVKIGKVAGGKFFNLTKVYTLEELAEFAGVRYDERWQEDDRQLVATFEQGGFEFLGCVLVKEELADALADEGVYWQEAYLVRGCLGYGGKTKKRTYLVTNVWDESHGQGETRAYRWSVQGPGSFEWNTAQRAYRKVMA